MTKKEQAQLRRAVAWWIFLLKKIQPLVNEDEFQQWTDLIGQSKGPPKIRKQTHKQTREQLENRINALRRSKGTRGVYVKLDLSSLEELEKAN